jgi:hypothetical protein
MNIEQLVEWELAVEPGVLGENLHQCHFVNNISNITWLGAVHNLLDITLEFFKSTFMALCLHFCNPVNIKRSGRRMQNKGELSVIFEYDYEPISILSLALHLLDVGCIWPIFGPPPPKSLTSNGVAILALRMLLKVPKRNQIPKDSMKIFTSQKMLNKFTSWVGRKRLLLRYLRNLQKCMESEGSLPYL